jgi:hypothetical protein
VPILVHLDDGAQPRRPRLLAMCRLRRGLERLTTASAVESGTHMVTNTCQLSCELEELIAALDRRVPRVELAGEADIARDAAALRAKAVQRLAELTSTRPTATAVSAVLT